MQKLLLYATAIILPLANFKCKQKPPSNPFISIQNGQFTQNGKPYLFMGANFWQGMNLATKESGGDIERMRRELDKMTSLGISNLRIMAISEGPEDQPYRILPAVQADSILINEVLWKGLDLLLYEMQKRDMTATLVLNNFWPWSGGMAQYVNWYTGDSIPYPPPHPNGNWDTYQKYAARFYTLPKAKEHFRRVVKQLIERINTQTGTAYKNDPAILSWELANEPRGMDKTSQMMDWIDQTSKWIKSLDNNHLITTGAEGYTNDPQYTGTDFISMHAFPAIDYTTAHIWIQNWGWYDPSHHDSTYSAAAQKMKDYLRKHADESFKIGKPFVLEEFGIMRDNGSFDPAAATKNRDKYYGEVFEEVYQLAKSKKAAGVNFWAWSGEATPPKPGSLWKRGDPLAGDPPHEPQGWYSVYAHDSSTHQIIRSFALKLSELRK